MKYFSATYTDFIKFDRKPNEDFYLVSKKGARVRDAGGRWVGWSPIFVIADGVTQSHFQSGNYAFPAGARAAAEIFCHTALEYLENKLNKPEKLIEKAFDLTNKRIKELNINEGITEKLDYLAYDYFDTVGIVGFLLNDKVFYGFVGDCGMIIFDRDNKLKFQTEDKVAPVVKRVKKIYRNWNNLPKERRRLIMRKDFRNRLDGKGYGSFSGEEEVKKYYQIGSQNLDSGDLILFYSDGFLSYLEFPEFIEILRKQDKETLDEFTFKKANENYEKYGTDRTLIAVEF